jgi:hypothetical protein
VTSFRKGQSFLALIILIGAIVAAIGVTIAFWAGTFVNIGFGYQTSAQAQAAASSGAEDALLKLDRNAAFSSSGYSLGVGSTTASVSVTQNSPSTNFITIISSSTVSNHVGKVSVVLSENATTGQLTVVSWQETQ